jgi:peptide/nickel transport system substrate-binding protein
VTPVRRRTLLGAAAAGALARPAIGRAAGASTLRFIPQSDLTILDPIWTTAYVTRNHGYLVFDTLFGQDAKYQPTLQMLESAGTENDGRLWRLVLRPGLAFHDGTPVLARDCVASLHRWMVRDAFGGALLAATDEVAAADDRTIVVRLKKPFPLLPQALGKTPTLMPAMMPERLAKTDPFKQVTEMVGSGPYRFKADERVVGARVVYERNAAYRPRENGVAEWTAGPKVAHFDRIEWNVIPDEATAAAALQANEADWWEYPSIDLLPLLARDTSIRTRVPDPTGSICVARLNHLQPPFDNPAIRRALLGAVVQSDFMTAVAGTDRKLWRDDVGMFCPGTPMASDVGLDVLTGPRDLDRVRKEIAAAGYKGEKAVILSASDFPFRKALADVGADMMQKAGLAVDEQSVDWGTLVQRRENKGPVDAGGWSMIVTNLSGLDLSNPASHAFSANGTKAWFGWPTSAKLEALRQDWLDAPDLAAQQRICRDMQAQCWVDVPQIPVGLYYQPTAYRADLDGMLDGFAMFWNIRRTG